MLQRFGFGSFFTQLSVYITFFLCVKIKISRVRSLFLLFYCRTGREAPYSPFATPQLHFLNVNSALSTRLCQRQFAFSPFSASLAPPTCAVAGKKASREEKRLAKKAKRSGDKFNPYGHGEAVEDQTRTKGSRTELKSGERSFAASFRKKK